MNALWNSLLSKGNIIELDIKIDGDRVVEDLKKFDWTGYSENKFGLSVTGDSSNQFTEVYEQQDIKNVVNKFVPHNDKIHLIKFNEGGYLKPHRDHTGIDPKYFSLLCVFGNTHPDSYVHVFDGDIFYPEKNTLYFFNFQLKHSVFCYEDGLHALVIDLKLTPETHDIIMRSMK